MTERKNAFRAVVDALIEARNVEATREMKKYAGKANDVRFPSKFL